MEEASLYLPMDRRQALARGATLPECTKGAALFADISGFTLLTETLARELGPKRGAEELSVHLNRVYNALIAELHRYGGSVISFSGDAITCWLDGDDGSRATVCALAMQEAMTQFRAVETAGGSTVSLAMKAAVASGPVRRFLVGNTTCCLIEVLAGGTLERLAAAEHLASRGEVILDPEAAASLADRLQVVTWREDEKVEGRFAVVSGLVGQVPDSPWPTLDSDSLSGSQICSWLLPPVYQRLAGGQGEFLAELRPAVALFLRFAGIDYDKDPEAAGKLETFVLGVQDIVRRYEGSLMQLTIGDKGNYLYVAFGAPIAHEDDATRAASTALELQDLAGRLDFLIGVQIGIAQGRMRTGAYGSQTRRTYAVLGDAVNLAARLMSAAELGQILVSDRARAAAGDAFTWERLPAILVKGKEEPVPLSQLTGRKRQLTIHLLEPGYALPMVGREAELALITEKVEKALQGQGQIVGITAEVGMGKSRLAAEVIRLAQERGMAGYGGECQSYGTSTSYLVWQSVWQGLFGLGPDASLSKQIVSLEAQLGQINPRLLPRLPLLGGVLNLPIPDNDLTSTLDAKLRKSSLEALLVDCLRACASEQALFLVLEDCHWLDPLSHDLLEVIGKAMADLPVLLLLVYRQPEIRRLPALRVSQLPHFTEVALAEFTPAEGEQLIRLKLRQFFGEEAGIAPDFVARITDRAAGNPFYIEELLNYLRDRGIRPNDAEAMAGIDLPVSLYSLVLTRMDQLTESQQTTLKVASVIGRLFKAAMIWGVYPQLGSFERVKADLEVLRGLDLTPLGEPEPELTYMFKHIITQEVAYESLLYATRAMLHDQIGQYIEETHCKTLDQHVSLLAYHYEHSANEPKKREYLLRAGEAAQADYANQAAIGYYEKVLPLLPAEEQVSVLLKLGKVLELIGEWQAAGKRYQQALELAEEIGDRAAEAWSQTALGTLLGWKQGEYAKAATWLEHARTRFEELADQTGVGQVLHIWGTLAAQQGDLETARTRYEESLVIRRNLEDKANVAALLSNLGIVARLRGDYDAAQALHEEALPLRYDLGDMWAVAISLHNLGNIHLDKGELQAARTQLEVAAELQQEIGDRQAIANTFHSLGNVARDQGDYVASRIYYEDGLSILWALGEKWLLAHMLEDMGGLAALQRQLVRALLLRGAAAALRTTIGAPISPAYEEKLETMLEPARQALGEQAADRALAQGEAMSLQQAVEYALRRHAEPGLELEEGEQI